MAAKISLVINAARSAVDDALTRALNALAQLDVAASNAINDINVMYLIDIVTTASWRRPRRREKTRQHLPAHSLSLTRVSITRV